MSTHSCELCKPYLELCPTTEKLALLECTALHTLCCDQCRMFGVMWLQSYRKMHPFCIPFAITNMSSALLAMDLGFMGPNYNLSTACATGNYCILK